LIKTNGDFGFVKMIWNLTEEVGKKDKKKEQEKEKKKKFIWNHIRCGAHAQDRRGRRFNQSEKKSTKNA